MKKNLFIIVSVFTAILAGCTTSNSQLVVDIQEGEQLFNSQVDNFQYIKDLEDFLSCDILSMTDNKPYNSEISIEMDFDEKSSLQGGVKFYQKKFSKSHNLENSDIEFSVKAENSENDTKPFDVSGSVSLLYKNNEMYANLHSLEVFMGEGNVVAKMYTLLGNMVIGKWVDLEVNSGGIIEIDESDSKRLPYIVGSFKNVLKTENIQSSPNFLASVSEIVDIVNSYIDLGISTNELKMINSETSYVKLGDEIIQKEFTGNFQGKESSFDLSFVASKQGLKVYLYNIKQFNEENSSYQDDDKEFIISLEERKKSEYLVEFEYTKLQQKIVDLEGEIRYANGLNFSMNVVMEPLEIIVGQSISGKLEGNIVKELGEGNREIPEITGEVLLLSELLSSL